jgi:hypothetical protein
VTTYLTGTCGIDSLDEIACLDGIDDVDQGRHASGRDGDDVNMLISSYFA